MEIVPLKSTVSDNWFYLLSDGGEALLIDPIDPGVAVDAVKSRELTKVEIFATHGHADHVGGNDAVAEALGCKIIGSAYHDDFPVRSDIAVRDGHMLTVGKTQWRVVHAPGHTGGHIGLYGTPAGSAPQFISGDLLFVGGCGNCRFGGDVREMFSIFADHLPQLPPDTQFYPGHDYAERNFEFILTVEPHNSVAHRRLKEVRARDAAAGPYLTTIGEEREYNPFFRHREAQLQARLFEAHPDRDTETTDPAARAFRILRGLRDAF